MEILAHRGFWKTPSERNTPQAFDRAVAGGYGIETDIRDDRGRLVIAHDMPRGGEQPFVEVARLCAAASVTLAINIKSDGLAAAIEAVLGGIPRMSAFCFDMSGPETLQYQRRGLPFYTRLSDIEPAPVLLHDAAGIWLDAFHSEWYAPDTIASLVQQGKRVAVVSPELHRRPHGEFWAALRQAAIHRLPQVALCTDFPDEAARFFGASA